MHVIAAKAVAFGEALGPEFRTYIDSVIDNAKCWPKCCKLAGVTL